MKYPDTPDALEDPEWFEDEEGPDRDILLLMDDEGEWLDEEDECFD